MVAHDYKGIFVADDIPATNPLDELSHKQIKVFDPSSRGRLQPVCVTLVIVQWKVRQGERGQLVRFGQFQHASGCRFVVKTVVAPKPGFHCGNVFDRWRKTVDEIPKLQNFGAADIGNQPTRHQSDHQRRRS